MSQTGEVVTLAVRSVDASVGRQVADTLPTIAVTPSAAGGVTWGLLAGIRAHCVLTTLTVRTHVAGVTGTHSTLEGAIPIVALRTVGFYFFLAVTVTFCTDEYFQGVPQSHRLYDKVPASSLTVGYAHRHIEGCCISDFYVGTFLLVWEEDAIVTESCERQVESFCVS